MKVLEKEQVNKKSIGLGILLIILYIFIPTIIYMFHLPLIARLVVSDCTLIVLSIIL